MADGERIPHLALLKRKHPYLGKVRLPDIDGGANPHVGLSNTIAAPAVSSGMTLMPMQSNLSQTGMPTQNMGGMTSNLTQTVASSSSDQFGTPNLSNHSSNNGGIQNNSPPGLKTNDQLSMVNRRQKFSTRQHALQAFHELQNQQNHPPRRITRPKIQDAQPRVDSGIRGPQPHYQNHPLHPEPNRDHSHNRDHNRDHSHNRAETFNHNHSHNSHNAHSNHSHNSHNAHSSHGSGSHHGSVRDQPHGTNHQRGKTRIKTRIRSVSDYGKIGGAKRHVVPGVPPKTLASPTTLGSTSGSTLASAGASISGSNNTTPLVAVANSGLLPTHSNTHSNIPNGSSMSVGSNVSMGNNNMSNNMPMHLLNSKLPGSPVLANSAMNSGMNNNTGVNSSMGNNALNSSTNSGINNTAMGSSVVVRTANHSSASNNTPTLDPINHSPMLGSSSMIQNSSMNTGNSMNQPGNSMLSSGNYNNQSPNLNPNSGLPTVYSHNPHTQNYQNHSSAMTSNPMQPNNMMQQQNSMNNMGPSSGMGMQNPSGLSDNMQNMNTGMTSNAGMGNNMNPGIMHQNPGGILQSHSMVMSQTPGMNQVMNSDPGGMGGGGLNQNAGGMNTSGMKMELDANGLWVPQREVARIQCPHCTRMFNEEAATRHIPKCKDIKHRPGARITQKRSYTINKLGMRVETTAANNAGGGGGPSGGNGAVNAPPHCPSVNSNLSGPSGPGGRNPGGSTPQNPGKARHPLSHMVPPALESQWGQVQILLTDGIKAVNSKDSIEKTRASTNAGLEWVRQVEHYATKSGIMKGKLSRLLLPFNKDTDARNQHNVVVDLGSPELDQIGIPHEQRKKMVQEALRVRKFLRVKVADDADVELLKDSLQLILAFFQNLECILTQVNNNQNQNQVGNLSIQNSGLSTQNSGDNLGENQNEEGVTKKPKQWAMHDFIVKVLGEPFGKFREGPAPGGSIFDNDRDYFKY